MIWSSNTSNDGPDNKGHPMATTGKTLSHQPTETFARNHAGRTLYEQRARWLPGLDQPPAPSWDDLDESVRERWRENAKA
ncbi:hypothetical protein C8E99_1554 [Citricoccus muralis]|uniref:Uncharacterized protein n=2 Tax=Citricoccus muralis TaxID=169134 RepID=A0A3D9LE68_9MICC|nr:hypothetical protein C8E99_1554 [Citricoccus muralis]